PASLTARNVHGAHAAIASMSPFARAVMASGGERFTNWILLKSTPFAWAMCWMAMVTEAPFGMPIFSFSRSFGLLTISCAFLPRTTCCTPARVRTAIRTRMSDSFPVFRNSRGRASLAPAEQPPLGREQERVDDRSEEPEHEGSHDDLRRDEEGAALHDQVAEPGVGAHELGADDH